MLGNTFGEHFRLTTFGESHGISIGGVIDGCPSGLKIDFAMIDAELARRRGDGVEGTTERKESDHIEWQSGIMDGVTLGTPIAFLVRNKDTRSEDYDNLKEWQRAGHADYTYQEKYGIRDHRGGGRASARETVARVVAGAIAKQLLAAEGISISSEHSSIQALKPSDNQTIGGKVRCNIYGVKPGIGEPVFNKLNARFAYAMMSIPSAVSFEMGAGLQATEMTGADYADRWNEVDVADFKSATTDAIKQSSNCLTRARTMRAHFHCRAAETMIPQGSNQAITRTNHCGGVQGGISNGMPIEFTVGFHPVVTQIPLTQCRNRTGEVQMIEIKGRHDRCHVSRAAVIVESMAALTLMDLLTPNLSNL